MFLYIIVCLFVCSWFVHVPAGPVYSFSYKRCVFQLVSPQLRVLIENVHCTERAGEGPVVFNDE